MIGSEYFISFAQAKIKGKFSIIKYLAPHHPMAKMTRRATNKTTQISEISTTSDVREFALSLVNLKLFGDGNHHPELAEFKNGRLTLICHNVLHMRNQHNCNVTSNINNDDLRTPFRFHTV